MNPVSQLAETTLRKPVAEPLVFESAEESPLAMAILEAMSDATSRTILNSIVAVGRSIEEITLVSGVPISTTYRRVHELCQKGLIIVERIMISNGGKRHSIYRSAFRGATIEVEFDRIRLEGLPNDAVPDITFRLWQFAESHREPPLSEHV